MAGEGSFGNIGMIQEQTAAKLGYPAAQTVAELIQWHAAVTPLAPAIVVPNRPALTYVALQSQIDGIGAELKRAGIGPGKRVAIILPDGPELAITIAAVACRATAVPLNPNLTAPEIEELFASQRLEAVILSDWADSPGREVAARRGVCQMEAERLEDSFRVSLRTPPLPAPAEDRGVGPDDVAFILRTSGTTARPKLVPITHRNLLTMAARLQDWFELTPNDRVLCVAPLYYAQGLKTSLFVPLILGSSLACPTRSPGADFLVWLTELGVTWYSAGPTLHRSVLERALIRGQEGFRHSLRFIYSGGALLPDAVRDGLETFFKVPVLDTYGISEAGQVAANSTDPKRRKRGTVGKPWPGSVAIRADDGKILGPGELGEIVVKGPGVTPGYIDDPETNRAAFTDGGFRTGDLGRIDSDGFLTVVGRTKELINRGGEKITPLEIDQALMNHPAVVEAAAFSVQHPRLGEDVAAAVVLRSGETVTPLDLRRFLRTTLVPFKIPRRIHIVAALPKGDTGKVRRQDLSRVYGADSVEHTAPDFDSPLAIEIADIWRRLLGGKRFGFDDDFFEMGGDSLLATQMLVEIERLTGKVLPDTILFETATIRQLADVLVQKEGDSDSSLLVQFQPGTGKRPFFFIDGDFWGGGFYVRKIALLLGREYPFYSLRSHGMHTTSIPTIKQMATEYTDLIIAAQPHGPYRLGGHCNGALIAWEVARQLVVSGRRVEVVAMIEPMSFNTWPSIRLIAGLLDGALRLVIRNPERREARVGSMLSLIWRAIRHARGLLHEHGHKTDNEVDALAVKIGETDRELAARYLHLIREYHLAMASYIPPPLDTGVLYFLTESHVQFAAYAGDMWRNLTPHLEIDVVPGDHLTCITTHAESLVKPLRTRLMALDREGGQD
jgi:acyl-CoA synthetase (AMP-forming)/AMP-acid ligase II/thioesterase domain-containing protein/acyl carrier protein